MTTNMSAMTTDRDVSTIARLDALNPCLYVSSSDLIEASLVQCTGVQHDLL